jgi:predicted CoA-binding protein
VNEPQTIHEMLAQTKTIAVVGISNKPERPSYAVAQEMQRRGYRIVPVNPVLKEVLGEPVYASLREIPFSVDMVDVFRAPEFVPQIVDDAIAIGAKYLWLQEGVVHPEATARAEAAGLKAVADRCIYKEHVRWQRSAANRA